MKKQSLILGSAIAATLASSMAVAGELSGNAGVVSQYFFRGVAQTATASANGGVDYDFGNGAAIGIWAADVGNADGTTNPPGIEYDLYGSYGGAMNDIEYSVGYTLYLYTGGFDTDYAELNLGVAIPTPLGPIAVDAALGGSHTVNGGPDEDYSFVSLSGDVGPVAVTYGSWGGDYSGEYVELGMSTDIGGADAGVSLINSKSSVVTDLTTNGTSLIFSLSKGFEL